MSEEADAGVWLVIMEDEQMRDEGEVNGAQEWSSPIIKHSTVMMTGDEFTDGTIPVRKVRDNEPGPMEDPMTSPLGRFQSLHSSQSSEKDKMISYVPLSEEIWVLQFEDTLSETDHINFNLIY